MSAERPPRMDRRGVGRDGILWAENAADGSWSTGEGLTRRVCPSLAALLADHGPLKLIAGKTRTPYRPGCRRADLNGIQRLPDLSELQRKEGTTS